MIIKRFAVLSAWKIIYCLYGNFVTEIVKYSIYPISHTQLIFHPILSYIEKLQDVFVIYYCIKPRFGQPDVNKWYPFFLENEDENIFPSKNSLSEQIISSLRNKNIWLISNIKQTKIIGSTIGLRFIKATLWQSISFLIAVQKIIQ